jgi:hypothetical protein
MTDGPGIMTSQAPGPGNSLDSNTQSSNEIRMQTVQVNELASASVIEIVRDEGGKVHPIGGFADSPTLEAVRVSDVLYLPSALETGQSLQIVRGRHVPIEAVHYEFTADFVKSRFLEREIASFDDFVDSEYAGDVCILGNVFSRNFTHWHEELMKVVALEQAGIDCVYVISELPAFARDLLELIGIPAGRILEVREPTRFRNALYTTPVSYINAADYPGVLMALRDRLLQIDVRDQPDCGSKLWLDRGQQTRLGRKLVNEEEVFRLLEKYDFQRLDMGALPIKAQISTARNMRVMSGLHGSQFVHSQLMPARSWVIECFSPIYLNPTYTEIYRVLRHRYSQISSTNTPVFPYPHGGDVLVDCQQLDLALRAASDS